jgi:flagellar biosynthetic protein FliP
MRTDAQTISLPRALMSAMLLFAIVPSNAHAQTAPTTAPAVSPLQMPDLTKPQNVSGTLQTVVLITVLSIVPAILLMMTSFTRIIIVLSLLRQALGTQTMPPNQILMGLAMFMTFVVMTPTLKRINGDALQPYLNGEIDPKTALMRAEPPLRAFMQNQITRAGNDEDIFVFTDASKQPRPKTWDQVPITSLIPAFMLSELKTAFLMGFKIYLPFLIIDMVVATVLISMGMMMMPPVLISLPFKLLLFVLVDGWRLISGNLMGSFVT